MPKWEAWLQGVADVMGPLMLHVPPHVGSMHPMDVLSTVQTAWKMRKLGERGVGDVTRLFTMSVSDLLNDWFESDAVKGMLTVNGVIGTWAGPDEPGTAYVMLHHSIGDVGDGHLGSWGFQQGGMGGVSTSIRTAAEAFGCEIRTGARVKKILVRNGRAVGVVLDDGQELRAPVVVSCIHPQIAFLDLIDRHELPPDFVWDIERWKTRSGVVKINVAISELPDFKAQPGKELQDLHTGSVELCFSSNYAEQAFQDAHLLRKPSVAPFVDGTIPTTLDKKLAPEGTHVFSYQVIGPYDMEQELGLIGGNIFHGELSADQLFHMRPAPGYGDYRTPLKGLYHGSSATHAGGGVNGIPGWQAYRQAKKDRAVRSK